MLHRSFRILVHFVGKQLVCQGCRTTRFAANRKVLDVRRLCRTKSSGGAAIHHVRQRVLQRIQSTRIPECVPREYNARDKGPRHTGKAIRHSLTSNIHIQICHTRTAHVLNLDILRYFPIKICRLRCDPFISRNCELKTNTPSSQL